MEDISLSSGTKSVSYLCSINLKCYNGSKVKYAVGMWNGLRLVTIMPNSRLCWKTKLT